MAEKLQEHSRKQLYSRDIMDLRKLRTVWENSDIFECIYETSSSGLLFASHDESPDGKTSNFIVYKFCLIDDDMTTRTYMMPLRDNPGNKLQKQFLTDGEFNKEYVLQNFCYEATVPNPVCIKVNKSIVVPHTESIDLITEILKVLPSSFYFDKFLDILRRKESYKFGIQIMPMMNHEAGYKTVGKLLDESSFEQQAVIYNHVYVSLLRLLLIGVYHMDFKRDNIMGKMNSDNTASICVIDFGISVTNYEMRKLYMYYYYYANYFIDEVKREDGFKLVTPENLFADFWEVVARYFRIEMINCTSADRPKWGQPQFFELAQYLYGDKFDVVLKPAHYDEKKAVWNAISNPSTSFFTPQEIRDMNVKRDAIINLLDKEIDRPIVRPTVWRSFKAAATAPPHPHREMSESLDKIIDESEPCTSEECTIMGGRMGGLMRRRSIKSHRGKKSRRTKNSKSRIIPKNRRKKSKHFKKH